MVVKLVSDYKNHCYDMRAIRQWAMIASDHSKVSDSASTLGSPNIPMFVVPTCLGKGYKASVKGRDAKWSVVRSRHKFSTVPSLCWDPRPTESLQPHILTPDMECFCTGDTDWRLSIPVFYGCWSSRVPLLYRDL